MGRSSTGFWCCFAGMLFGTAWWLFIDSYIWDKVKNQFRGNMDSIISYIPGILGTVGFFIVNFIPRNSMSSELFGKELSACRRVFMLIAFAITFSSLISAFWIFFSKYSTEEYTLWIGFAMLIHTFLLFISTYIFRFKRATGEFSEYYY